MLTLTDLAYKKLIAGLIRAGSDTTQAGAFANCYVGLYQDGPPPSQDAVLSALTEADYDGYARQGPVEWSPEYVVLGVNHNILGDLHTFSPTGSVVGNTVKGFFIADAETAGNLLAMEEFPELISLGNTEQAVHVAPQLTAGNGTIGGEANIVG